MAQLSKENIYKIAGIVGDPEMKKQALHLAMLDYIHALSNIFRDQIASTDSETIETLIKIVDSVDSDHPRDEDIDKLQKLIEAFNVFI